MSRDALILSDPSLSKLTPEQMEALLQGTGLVPKQGWAWLSRAVQGVLWAARTPPELSAERRGNDSIQAELFAVAKPLTEAARLLQERTLEFDNAVLDAAHHGFEPQRLLDESPDQRTFGDAVHHVEWLAVFLRRAAMLVETQKPQWKNSARKEERIWRAQCLSVAFSLAFDREPTVNNWETAKRLGPWADFYQRIVAFTYGEHLTPNLLEVLKTARRLDKVERVRFGPGILPN